MAGAWSSGGGGRIEQRAVSCTSLPILLVGGVRVTCNLSRKFGEPASPAPCGHLYCHASSTNSQAYLRRAC